MSLLKNKIQLNKFEVVIGFSEQVMDQAAAHLATRRCSKGLYKMGGFKKEAINKRKKKVSF